jgi:MFS family permease
VAGQILGGVLVSAQLVGGAWRAVFFVNVPVGAAVVAAGARYLPRGSDREARRMDLAGVLTLSSAVLLVVLPLVLGRAEGWPAWTWLSLAASLPAGAAPDISGVATTTMQIAGALGVATFGTVYLGLASDGAATQAFAVVTAGFAAIAVLAAGLAAGATRPVVVR